jgi:hypothetical protein
MVGLAAKSPWKGARKTPNRVGCIIDETSFTTGTSGHGGRVEWTGRSKRQVGG